MIELKKTFYVAYRISSDVRVIVASTWWEAMDKAFVSWGCKISRHDMYQINQKPLKPQIKWQQVSSF